MRNHSCVTIFVSVLLYFTPASAQTVQGKSNQHPYDYALDFCRDSGGLAQYSVSGNTVKFSCGDDLSRIFVFEM